MANQNTNPGGGKLAVPGVMHSPDVSRARTYAREVDRRDIKDIPCSQTARVRVRAYACGERLAQFDCRGCG